MFSRDQLKRAASLTEEDFAQLGKCRRPHNRFGFAYQVAFVRLFDRFPQQQHHRLSEAPPFDDAEAAQLEQFLCEETCRLEQAAALMGRAREFLKSSACSSALAFRIARIVGEQRARAREHIFRRPTQSGRFPLIA